MPTAKFVADFASFLDATERADVRLAGFEGSANKVQGSLTKLANSLSGTSIVQQAALAAEAVERIGGVSKLTEAELARVGATATEAAAKLRALGQDVPAGIQRIADAAHQVSPPVSAAAAAFGGLADQITATALGFLSAEAVLSAVTVAWRTLTGVVTASVAAYSKQEDAEVTLTAALRQHGLATPEVIAQYGALATQFQAATKYADEDTQAMERLLTQVGNLMPSQMRAALQAAQNLAAGLGIDLERATMLVAKAAAGHTETLGRYGITVDAAALATQGFSAVLEVIERQFGGAAAAAAATYAGQVAQIANAWDNVQEALGKVVVQDPFVSAALAHMLAAARGADEGTQGAAVSIADLALKLGVLDRGTADALNVLGLYAGETAQVATTAAQAAAALGPLALTVDALARAMTAGTGAAGFAEAMRLQAQFVAEHAAALRADEEALRRFTAAQVELAAAGVGWQGTLEAINGDTVAAVRYYLAAGVAQATLAAAYGLTAAQVKAIATALDLEGRALADAEVRWAETAALKVRVSGTATDQIKAQIDVWVAHEIEAHQRARTDTADFYAWLSVQAGLLQQDADRQRLLGDAASRESYAHRKAAADDWLQFVLAHAQEFTRADIALAVQRTQAATQAWATWGAAAAAALDTATTKARALEDAAAKAARALGSTVTYDLTTREGVEAYRRANTGMTITWSDEQIQAFARGGGTLQQLQQAGVVTLRPYGEGGSTGAGGPALLHADEYVVPRGGALVREGGGGDTYITVQTLLGTVDALAAAIGQAQLARTGRLVVRAS